MWKTTGFSMTMICKWWVFPIFASLQESNDYSGDASCYLSPNREIVMLMSIVFLLPLMNVNCLETCFQREIYNIYVYIYIHMFGCFIVVGLRFDISGHGNAELGSLSIVKVVPHTLLSFVSNITGADFDDNI
jgi:hypothetical protein